MKNSLWNGRQSSAGFTLIEVMVVMGILSLASLAVMSLLEMQVTGQKKTDQLSNVSALVSEMVSVLSDPTSCFTTLGNLNALNTGAGVILNLKKVIPGPPVQTNTSYGVVGQPTAVTQNNVSIVSYALASTTNVSDPNGIFLPAGGGNGATNLSITFQSQVGGSPPIVRVRQFKIGVVVDSQNKIKSCEAFGIPMNNAVIGDLNVSGGISAGTTIRLNSNNAISLPTTGCGGAGNTPVGMGTLFYNPTDSLTYFCDGYAWYPTQAPDESAPIGGMTWPTLTSCYDPQGRATSCLSGTAPTTGVDDRNVVSQLLGWCPPGYAIYQINGSYGWAFDTLTLQCRNSAGATVSAGTIGNTAGGGPFTGTACSAGSTISAIAFKTSTSENRPCGYKITGIKYWCSTAARPDVITNSYTVLGTHVPEFAGAYWQKFQCPHGEGIGEIRIWQERNNDWSDPTVPGTNRANCDCRRCVANITAVCRNLNPLTSTSVPTP